MKICIIEDDEYKMKDLVEWVDKNYPTSEIIKAKSLRSASEALTQGPYSFILLDMQLKLYEDPSKGISSEKLAVLGGERILKQLQRQGSKEKVIVITQYTTFSEKIDEVTFEALCGRLKLSCPDVFSGGIQYLFGSNSWRKSLSELVHEII